MKRVGLAKLVLISGVLIGISHPVSASVIIDPLAGWSGDFFWRNGLGPITYVDLTSDNDWSITAATDSQMSFATAYDIGTPGDEFALVLDGTQIAWDTTLIDVNGYFHGEVTNLFLSEGTHLFTINVTAINPETPTGRGIAEFSGITEIMNVPEPATLSLMGMALLGFLRCRRKIL